MIGIAALAILPSSADSAKGEEGNPKVDLANVYGVIEIGGSGVKTMLFAKDGENVKFLKKYEPTEANAFSWTASSSGLVADAVADSIKKMQGDYAIPDNHFKIVGSSGVPHDIRQSLSESIIQRLHLKPDYISVEQESQLVFQNLVPKADEKQVVVLDIGSGNSKGSYADVREEGTRLVSFSIPFGTKTFAEEVDAERKDGAFLVTAESLREQVIQPAVRDNVQIAPEMQRREKIYLVGGIPWAMTTLLRPFDTSGDLIRLSPDEIKAFLTKAINSPRSVLQPNLDDAPHQPTQDIEKARQKASGAIAKIGNIYTDNQIVAGAIILQTFLEEMHYQDKEVYFNTQGLYAWPEQYVINMSQADAAK